MSITECPAWRLRLPHYLNVPGTIWEHVEISRESGEQARQTYPVPRLLDPNDPKQCNRDGDCVVFLAVDGAKPPTGKAYAFLGDPTPDMEPINDEAQEITNQHRHRWENPIESLPANGGMTEAESTFMERMMSAFSGAISAVNQSVPKAQYDELAARLAALEAKSAPAETQRRL